MSLPDASARTSTRDRSLALEVTSIAKSYGKVVALEDASLTLRKGECLALIGDNGAGKSTLIKTIAGAVSPDSGDVRLHGAPVAFSSPLEARHAGIETVYQDLALATTLGASENVFLGREVVKPGILGRVFRMLDKRAMRTSTARTLQELKVNLPSVETPVIYYSGGQRQAVAIARSISNENKVLILDEPTAALGVPQKKVVIGLIQTLKEQSPDLGIILITHDLSQVFAVCDRVTVLRHGRDVATHDVSEVSEHQLIADITGLQL